METFDVVVVGSGINSLVCGALLAKRGKRVLVLERNDVAGGCIRTEALTEPGFLHDTLSTLYPLFVTAPHFATLQPDLARHGVEFLNTALPTAVLLPDGRSLVLRRDRDANVEAFEALAAGDGAAYRRAMGDIERSARLTFGLLGSDLWTWGTARLLLSEACSRGANGLARLVGGALGSCRDWLEAEFQSDLTRALMAPWILHVGLSPESTLSAHMGKLILFTLEQAGSPMVKGGSARIVEAFGAIITGAGGEVRTGVDVDEVIVRGGHAIGVRTEAGDAVAARDAVVCNVTPTQLHGRLLRNAGLPPAVRSESRRYRYGRGEMQIHLALSEPPQWPDPDLGRVAMLHVTPGLDGVSRAVNEAERGLLPAEATIVVAQPVAVDASRAPPGRWIFWIQLQELPSRVRGDALGVLPIPEDGLWTLALKEAYADRIVARLEVLIPNLRRSILGRRVISPADLEALNVNLVGGDPYSGSCALDQFMLWRSTPGGRDHATPVKRLLHIGASTHPGPGLGGMSGYLASRRIR